MATVTFDTHKVITLLERSGLDRTQAEGITEALKEAFQTTDLVTKLDLEVALAPIRSDIAALKVQATITLWLLGLVLAAQFGLIAKVFLG